MGHQISDSRQWQGIAQHREEEKKDIKKFLGGNLLETFIFNTYLVGFLSSTDIDLGYKTIYLYLYIHTQM